MFTQSRMKDMYNHSSALELGRKVSGLGSLVSNCWERKCELKISSSSLSGAVLHMAQDSLKRAKYCHDYI